MGMKLKFLVTALAVVMFAAPAFALNLGEAKAKGLVGETPSGYLAAVNSSSESVALVADVNSKRKQEYAKIAEHNGTPVGVVESLAGKKAIQITPPGQFVQNESGKWVKK